MDIVHFDRISMPMTSTVYKAAAGKMIYIFGDTHYSLLNQCYPCKNNTTGTKSKRSKTDQKTKDVECVSFDDLLEFLFENCKLNLDFYVETPFIPADKTKNLENVYDFTGNSESVFDIIFAKFGGCLVPQKDHSCIEKYPTSRMHYTDIRKNDGYLQYFVSIYYRNNVLGNFYRNLGNKILNHDFYQNSKIDTMTDFNLHVKENYNFTNMMIPEHTEFVKKFTNRKTFVAFIDSMVYSDDLELDIARLFGSENFFEKVVSKFSKKAVSEYDTKVGRKKSYKIKKQIDRLDDKMKATILEFYEDQKTEILNFYDHKKVVDYYKYITPDYIQSLLDSIDPAGNPTRMAGGKRVIPSAKSQKTSAKSQKTSAKSSKDQKKNYTIHSIQPVISKIQSTLNHIGDITFEISLLLMDIYAIARMMRYYDESDIIINFSGDAHSVRYRLFIEKYLQVKIVSEYGPRHKDSTLKFCRSCVGTEDINRCLAPEKGFTFPLTKSGQKKLSAKS